MTDVTPRPRLSIPHILCIVCVLISIAPSYADDIDSNRIADESDKNVDYEYHYLDDDDDTDEAYQKWMEQNMLGKGQKIDEDEPHWTRPKPTQPAQPNNDTEYDTTFLVATGTSAETSRSRPTGEPVFIHQIVDNSTVVLRGDGAENLPDGSRWSSRAPAYAPGSRPDPGDINQPGAATPQSDPTLGVNGFTVTPDPPALTADVTSRNQSMMGEIRRQVESDKPVIYIAGLFPWSEDIPAGSVGRGVLPAVNIALQHINNDTRLRRKYTLKMAYNDTRCDMAVATRAFFDMMADSRTVTAMLFGDACYNVTGPIVQIAHQWNMFQLSYADTNPMLSDRDEFPNFYRTVPSDSDFNPARLALLRHFNWTTVGTLFQDAKLGEARHGYASNRFDSLVEKHKINISLVESFADDPKTAIKNLKDQDVRIIVGNFDQNAARKVFCSAYKHSMYGVKHQWIILGTYDVDWWQVPDPSITCTPAELNETLHGYLATDVLPLSTSNDVTESGRTSSEYQQLYDEARGSEYSKYHGYAYDGVWVIAKALDRLLEDTPLSADLFRGHAVGRVLNDTGFMGVTGRVQFTNGDRVGSMTILQMMHGKPPVDRSIKIEELRHVSFPVYIGFVVMAALGITMAVLFLALNIRFRRHRYIKMSSPNMNNLIIIGCILCYMSIFLLGAEPGHNNRTLFSYWCIARSWTLALGFTLSFGAMFGKTWRVHAIFTNIKLNKKVIKDYKLMLIVLVLVLLDAVILVTWQVVDPVDKAVKRLSPEAQADFEIIPKIDYCTSSFMEIWLGALYAYKGLLLAFGVFLAWETRHVTIPALNDSKYIGMSVYNVVIMCVCGAAVSFIIEDKPTQSFIIIGLFIIFCTTITLCLVFVPKIIQLKRNPKGDEQRVRATLNRSNKKSSKSESLHKEKIRTTVEENRRLRGFLEQVGGERGGG
ncbi:gamma-aminobutyric acid type B receptor subunit 2-like [Physella acuta]|uniref:gamma-aminobutyric acid type B receptor subunit 2-like n=1 Tax=Physella acuta TaxID=109671 RepID=UPI0027DADC6D|nr:gamma-aminobutyric acid type B receptor subunit 2-like [Physella acuta]